MVQYNLAHLVQPPTQEVSGPVQDDEALFLFALVRVMRLRNVLEIGGLGGYSARNFLEAVGQQGKVYTVDLNAVPKLADNHVTIQKDAQELTAADLGGTPLDLLFFDAHVYAAQINVYHCLRREGMVNDATLLAFHDTNLHPSQFVPWAYPVEGGWVHQAVERMMVNDFKRMGYDALVLGTDAARHGADLPFRHGLTLMQKFKPLIT